MYATLPDPDHQAEFYADVPTKRALAWCVDAILIAIVTVIVVPFTLLPGSVLSAGAVSVDQLSVPDCRPGTPLGHAGHAADGDRIPGSDRGKV